MKKVNIGQVTIGEEFLREIFLLPGQITHVEYDHEKGLLNIKFIDNQGEDRIPFEYRSAMSEKTRRKIEIIFGTGWKELEVVDDEQPQQSATNPLMQLPVFQKDEN